MNKLFFFKDIDSHYVIYILGIRFCIKHKCNLTCKEVTSSGIEKNSNRNPRLIVSLTSFPARINTVHLTITTLLQQTLKPDKLILWLAKDQFPNLEQDLPEKLVKLKEYGLEIEWYSDIKSFKKLVPALKKYPEDIIVAVDDDVYYQPNMLESLYNAYLKDPKNIYVKRSVRLKMNNGYPEDISSRKYFYKHLTKPSYFNQLMSGSGCLYPPHSLHNDCTNLEKIQRTVPTHDDVYFWAMAILNRTKIQVVGGFDEDLLFVGGTQDIGLIKTNKKGQGGVSLKDAYKIMIKEYPEISSILAEDLTPSLEVFVLTWNRLEYLKQTLNSLLNSTVSNFKITVVDNASDDGTSNYLQDLQNQNPRIRHIRIPEHFNSNIDSMVKAISEITADYAMIFHDDDIIHCQYIELAQHILKNYNNIDIICTGANRFSKEFQIKQNLCKKFHLRVFSSKLNFAEMVFINKLGKDLCYPNIIYRRENLVKSVKHFVFSDFGKISDRPFVLETVQNGQAVFIEEQMINYRVHEKQDSATNSNGPYDNEIINLLKYFKQILQEKWYSYFIYTVHSYYWLKSLNKWGYLDRPLNIIAKKAFEAGVINKYTYNLCSSSFAPILSKLNYAFKKLFIMAEYKKQIIQFNNKQS